MHGDLKKKKHLGAGGVYSRACRSRQSEMKFKGQKSDAFPKHTSYNSIKYLKCQAKSKSLGIHICLLFQEECLIAGGK